MEHVCHAVHEDQTGLFHDSGVLSRSGIKRTSSGAGLVPWDAHPPQAWVKSEHIAVVTARRYASTAVTGSSFRRSIQLRKACVNLNGPDNVSVSPAQDTRARESEI